MMRKNHLTDGAFVALEQRGIDIELADRLGVVSVDPGRGDNREWIGFRHFVDGGESDHWAYRAITGSKDNGFRQSAGTARKLWNNEVIIDRSLAHVSLIITEGHIDAMSLMVAGFERVVSVPDGAPAQVSDDAKAKYAYLDGSGIGRVNEVILATDDDNAGHSLLHDLAIRIGRGKCKWIRYPDGCKDANDVLVKHGAEELVRCINGARWIKLPGLYTLDEVPPEPPEEIIQIGINGIDDFWRPARGRMSVLVGIPGHGKSALLTDVVCRVADRHGWVVAIASLEDSLRGTLMPRLQRWYLQGDPDFARPERLPAADQWIGKQFVFLQPDDDGDETPTVDWFLDRAAAAVTRHNVSMVVLDPWNEIDHTNRPPDVPMTEYVGTMLSKLRRHAKAYRYHLIVAAHPTKLHKTAEGKYPEPTGYHIADSANFVNKPDNGITIYRRSDDVTKIGCWKCRREGVIGKRGGRMTYQFIDQTQRYIAAPDLLRDEEARE